MIKQSFFCFFSSLFAIYGQESSLPADLRQHALTEYNSSLFNPTFSLDRNNPQSLSFWSRWQWQDIDADPTTLFLNYTRKLKDKTAIGIGFFQHNTGVFFNTGSTINYAREIKFNRLVKLSFGANLFAFKQEFADDRVQIDPNIPLPGLELTDDFILQFAPGINLSIENFSFSLASENLFDYNFTNKESNTASSDKIFMGMASYNFPIMASDATAFLRPSIYLRTIPEEANQIGANALFSTKRYWGQVGFNNFYGISLGAGGSFFNRLSLGALVELGTSGSVNSEDPSFEIIASYFLGKAEKRRRPVSYGFGETDETIVTNEKLKEELESLKTELEKANKALAIEKELQKENQEQEDTTKKQEKKAAKKLAALAKEQKKDSIATAKEEKEALVTSKKQKQEQEKIALKKSKKEAAIANKDQKLKEEQRLDAINKIEEARAVAERNQLEEKRKIDSISQLTKTNALIAEQKLEQQRRIDAINTAKAAAEELAAKKEREATKVEEAVKLEAGEKYEEVAKEGDLEPGFYLIANVFGTKKYFNAFMQDLKSKGLQPRSFFRTKNNYNYAYLKRYNTIKEARKARDSRFNGNYQGKTWIFRVVGE